MIRKQQPEQILDREGLFRSLLEELPALSELYLETKPGVFVKK